MRYFLSAALFCIAALPVWAQQKSAEVIQVQTQLDLDGLIDPDEWRNATLIADLHQVIPVEYASPGERSEFRVMFDEDNLYIAGRAWDSQPQRISADTMRQGGSISNDDHMAVLLDAFNNKRSGYLFQVNANGVRSDAIYTNGTSASDDWQGVWQASARQLEDGWSMEMAIPFKTLTFDPENPTWGINVWRFLARNNETIAWVSANGEMNPTAAGEISGLSNLSQGVGLDIMPSFSASRTENHLANSSDSDLNPSLDLTYKLTPSLNLTATLNTDFSATEVDGRQLDLSRFSLFFPEKRSFFLTDFDIFSFGGLGSGGVGRGGGGSDNNGLPFFSRRIGLNAAREAVDLTGGIKLSGRQGDYDIGALVIRQDASAGVDATDLIVARLARSVLEESSVGAIFTFGDPLSNERSSTAGIDFQYRNDQLPNNRSIQAVGWVQKTSNPGFDGDDLAWKVGVDLPSRNSWQAEFNLSEFQENYDPRLGFANRVGVRNYSASVGLNQIESSRDFPQRVSYSVEYERWDFLDTGDLQEESMQFTTTLQSSAGDNIQLRVTRETQGLLAGERPLRRIGIDTPAGEYSYTRWRAHARSSGSRSFSASLALDGGGYYQGDREGAQVNLDWSPSPRIFFGVNYSLDHYQFPGVSTSTRVSSFDNEIVFTPKLSLVSLVQWDNLSDELGANIRLRWELAPGNDIWLVANHNMIDLDEDLRFTDQQTDLAFKIRYTFRY